MSHDLGIDLRHDTRAVTRGELVTRSLSPMSWRAFMALLAAHPAPPPVEVLDAAIWPGKLITSEPTQARTRVMVNVRAMLSEVDLGIVGDGRSYRLVPGSNVRLSRRRGEDDEVPGPEPKVPVTLPRVRWLERTMP